MIRQEERLITELDPATNWQTTRDRRQTAAQARKEKVTVQPHEELSLLIESVEDDIASAKVAVEADGDVREETRQAVLDAHLTICLLKAKM